MSEVVERLLLAEPGRWPLRQTATGSIRPIRDTDIAHLECLFAACHEPHLLATPQSEISPLAHFESQ